MLPPFAICKPASRPIGRRRLIGATAALAGAAAMPALLRPRPALATAIPPSGTLVFDVSRGGDPMGEHVLEFRQHGDRIEVTVTIEFAVSIAFITVFRYTHRNREIWENGRLISLDSSTDDDGDAFFVRAERSDAGLEVDGSSGRFTAPAETLSATYWRAETIDQQRLLDTQYGRLADVRSRRLTEQVIEAAQRQVVADRYRTEGDLDLDVWYSPAGQWVKLAFEARGATVDYTLRGGSGALADG